MQIIKIKVLNFCSIKQAEIIPSKFNVSVGQNNHGKTNLFEAVSWFYTGKGSLEDLRFGRTGSEEVCVELEFSGVQDALRNMKNEKNRVSIQKIVGNCDTVKAKRTSLDPKVRKIFDNSTDMWLEKNPAGFDSAFNDFLPVFEYIDTGTHLADVAKYGKTTAVGSMLSAVLASILETTQQYKEFRQKFDELFTSPSSEVCMELNKLSGKVTHYVAKQFPDCTQVSFKSTEPAFEELLKGCSTEVDDGVLTDASEKGDGMQRALMLAILQTYADFRKKGEAVGKSFLFFIDEAELHLHPTAQRHLKAALRDIADSGDQVFINTHSSVLIADEHGGQSIFKVEKFNKVSVIKLVTQTQKGDIIYELLGGSPADLLLPRNFMIVEGRCESEFLRVLISRFYLEMPNIQIIFSEGDIQKQERSMNAINAAFTPLAHNSIYKDKLVILCDSPHVSKQIDFENFKKAYSYLEVNSQLHVLPVGSLEEYYPGQYKKTPEQVVEASRSIGMKLEIARHVASQIVKDDFERDMSVIKKALDICWQRAHK